MGLIGDGNGEGGGRYQNTADESVKDADVSNAIDIFDMRDEVSMMFVFCDVNAIGDYL